MGLLDLFFGSSDSTMSFYHLYNKLKGWKKAKVFPYTYNLPKAISFPNDFWDGIVKIQKQTLSDGNERAMSIYWADGELVVSPIDKGDSKSVTSRGNIQVSYKKHPTREGYLRKEVFLNSSLYKRADVYYKRAPKEIEVEYLFNMHTHPHHMDSSGGGYYNFFSAQDIKSLISSNAPITGLVTDRLWLLFRTNVTPSNVDSLTDENVSIEKLKELNVGLYSGEFYKRVKKI